MARPIGDPNHFPRMMSFDSIEKSVLSQFDASQKKTNAFFDQAFKSDFFQKGSSALTDHTFSSQQQISGLLALKSALGEIMAKNSGFEHISHIKDLIDGIKNPEDILKSTRVQKKPTVAQPQALVFKQPKTFEKLLSKTSEGHQMVFETPKGQILAPKSAELPKTITTVAADGVEKTHDTDKVVRIDDEVFHSVKDAVVTFARYELSKSTTKPEEKKGKAKKASIKKEGVNEVEPKRVQKKSVEKTQTQESLKEKAKVEQKMIKERLADRFFENLHEPMKRKAG